MSPRTGRPKLENAMRRRIGVRLDAETAKKLYKMTVLRNETTSEIIRKAIEREYEETQKK